VEKDEADSFDRHHAINEDLTEDSANFRALLGDVRDNNLSLSLISDESSDLIFTHN
jgi:hypothetical protein